MAQMPIHFMSGRADPYSAAGPAQASTPPQAAVPRASYRYDTNGISGGLLRPGAIDQELFKAHLAAAQTEAAVAPQAPARAPSFAGIPTLSPAQLAALGVDVGAVEEPARSEPVLDIPAPRAATPGNGISPELARAFPFLAAGAKNGTGTPATPLHDTTLVEAAPTAPESTADATGTPETPPAPPSAAPAAQASSAPGPIPGSRRGADGVWELPRLPDKDEREMLRGQKWRVVESEQASKLFLGPDGEFGWDDFLDIINPLQHIPLVNVAYRAITGDEIYGAARMVDVAFGPLAAVSTVVDLAFRDVTGESMASNAVAALFGPDEEPAAEIGSINTASANDVHRTETRLFRRGSNK
ncbi:hypothetical protein [Dongia deserti]|uniref:hypothetical protein n=1 Tax=Dongia deserti TaxID=2268030 RepID=UPI0013C4036E|nr:hypothetical protein [Dongia deserti]